MRAFFIAIDGTCEASLYHLCTNGPAEASSTGAEPSSRLRRQPVPNRAKMLEALSLLGQPGTGDGRLDSRTGASHGPRSERSASTTRAWASGFFCPEWAARRSASIRPWTHATPS